MNQNIHTFPLLSTRLRQTHAVLTFPRGNDCYSHFVEGESKRRTEGPSPRPRREDTALSSMPGPLL